MIIAAGVLKLAYHHTPILSKYVIHLDLRALPFDRNLPELIPSLHFRHFPESCALIIIGLLVGVIVYYGNQDHSHHFPSFTASLFFNVLLPPIILGNIAVNNL